MSSGESSGLTAGNQTSLEQEEEEIISRQNEEEAEQLFAMYELRADAPIKIPSDASIRMADKQGYQQVEYKWSESGYDYSARWHTRTPNSPLSQGASWVVERRIKGVGYGMNAKPSKTEFLLSNSKWISKEIWQSAIRAKKNGTLTSKQKEILNNGHHKSKIK